ncbi:MAG: type III pantothenate kinase [Pseudomonadota bacterium]
MLLAIDVGNTNTVMALLDNGQIIRQRRLSTVHTRTVDEYAILTHSLLAEPPADSILTSVVPAVTAPLAQHCQALTGTPPILIGDRTVTIGVTVDMRAPREVGADRLVNTRAVIDRFSTPAIIIDIGTAATFDTINAQGHYIGGVIAPGPMIAFDALRRQAALLPQVLIEKPPAAIGVDTVTAMQSGLYWGYIDLVTGLTRRIIAEMDTKPAVIATGGATRPFIDSLEVVDHFEPDLTLYGLYRIWCENRDTPRSER